MSTGQTSTAQASAAAEGLLPVAVESPRRETVWLFAKGDQARFTNHFTLHEFHCRCRERGCSFTLVHPRLVDALQTLRERLARPLILSSGFRCKAYNRIVGGRLRSFHLRGMAADVVCASGEEIEELARAAAELSAIGGIGRYPTRGMVHLDVRPREPGAEPVGWDG